MSVLKTAAIALMAVLCILAGQAFASISYTVGGTGPLQFPGPITPPANAPWGPNGYPGDTVELLGYTGSLTLTPGSVTQKVNRLKWIIDYTYAGTATDPNAWSNLSFDFSAPRSMTLDGAGGTITQPGHLDVTWDNDFLSLLEGPATAFVVAGYQVVVTPLGLAPVGGSNFSGGNPWVQPDRDVLARFDITELPPVPEPTTLAIWSCLGMAGIGLRRWMQRRGK